MLLNLRRCCSIRWIDDYFSECCSIGWNVDKFNKKSCSIEENDVSFDQLMPYLIKKNLFRINVGDFK